MRTTLLSWLVLTLLIASCTNKQQPTGDHTKLLDYKYFTILVPQSWQRVDVRGIDSFVGQINIDSVTSISFDLGWYCNKLDEGRFTNYYNIESGNVYTPDSSVKQNLNDPTHWKYYGKADSSTVEQLKRNKVTWIKIEGYHAKLVTPKKVKLGTTGIYIDSLWKTGDNADGFVLSGHNLTCKQQQQLLAAIKTLKFYQHPAK